MGFVTSYLNSEQMTNDIVKIAHSTTSNNLEYFIKQITCAMLRWQQWFENQYVDRQSTQLRQIKDDDFNRYREAILQLFTEKNIQEEKLRPQINQILLSEAKKILAPGNDLERRLVTLITTGACEYHGFNSYFTSNIKQHGLDPKFHNNKQFEPIYHILKRVGAPTEMGRYRDNTNAIYVTPDPNVAYLHSQISPKWFCYLNEDLVPFYINRDYQGAREKLFTFPGHEKLTSVERQKITDFFEQWWHRLVTPNNQKIAIMPMFRDPAALKDRLRLNMIYAEKIGLEKLLSGTMYVNYENIYQPPIDPKFIQIIDVPSNIHRYQRLTQVKNVFNQSSLYQTKQHSALIENPAVKKEPNNTQGRIS